MLGASFVSTAIHYTDNYLDIHDYPQPEWITRPTVYVAWLLFTAAGAIGYWLYTSGRVVPSYLFLLIYSYTGTSSLGHYLYGGFSDFSAKMHFFIWLDALAGFAVMAFVVWSAMTDLRARKLSTPRP